MRDKRWKSVLLLSAVGVASCAREIPVPGPPPDRTPPVPRPIDGSTGEPGKTGPRQGLGPTAFIRTQDSDHWVSQTFQIQDRHRRVLLVGKPEQPSVRIPRLALNNREPTTETVEYPVSQSFDNLQDAANAAEGGDLIAVLPGSYVGFVLGDKASAEDGSYIHIKALGAPGEVVIDRPSVEDPNWMIYLQAAHHVIIDGFNVAGASQPRRQGQQAAQGRAPRAGIMIDGSFGRTSKLAHHVVVLDNFSHHHRKWGLHGTDTHSVLLQGNLFSHSAEEHGAYASDGSDNWVVRRNVFFANHAGGFQANLDPESSIEELLTHPSFRGYGRESTRAWAENLLRTATQRFGEHGFPDGRGVNFIIEENVLNGNGQAGGAAINAAGLSESLIQNNLIYGNQSAGIALWNDDNLWDEPLVKPGPRTAAEVSGPETLPLWGCQHVVLRNNTVIMSRSSRAAIQCGPGSFGCRVRNNILINDGTNSLEIAPTAVYKFDASHNVLNQVVYDGTAPAFKSLAISLPEKNATLGVTRARVAAEFVRNGDEPWVLLDGSWWKLNPARPDFRPKQRSSLFTAQGDAQELPIRDLMGVKRVRPDLGALTPAAE
ncbi:right-handed parallel beta-helix repeat-containing protein [Chondromyces crocatus]|uniref:Right handed beta helix domain-containing protein n=1 Tax=Chondromyces crocatus TaxID=52 RepID=A0A0K1E7E3_CHOCO|nr:right-handed parallel beta-helix repeat-containing protein [Chondromyces crocatus]AKT36587.1 uncharacterized protein CMC5_007050 [Chondromyces crocatus]